MIELRNKEELITKINSLPEFQLIPLFKKLSKYEDIGNFIGVMNKDNKNIVGIVSPRYKLVQFKDTFLDLVDNFKDTITGATSVHGGKGYLWLKMSNNEHGILVINSVNKSTSLIINMTNTVNKLTFPLPRRFRKIHVGKVAEFAKNISYELEQLKKYWTTLVTKFAETKVDKETIDIIIRKINKSKKYKKSVMKALESKDKTLWTLFEACVRSIDELSYKKNEFRKFDKFNKISGVFEKQAIMLKI